MLTKTFMNVFVSEIALARPSILLGVKNNLVHDHTRSSIRIEPPRNMSVIEGAIYLGISERSLREQIARHHVKVIRFGRRIILRKIDLDDFLESLSS